MTMAISRRPARKSEPNLNSIRSSDESPRRYNGSGTASTGNVTGKRRRPWPWFWRSMPTMISAPSSPAASSCRPTQPRRLIKRLKYRVKRSNPICLVIFGVFFIWLVDFIVTIELGPRGSIKGGHMGNTWDQFVRDYTRYKTIIMWREQLRSELQIPIIYKEMEGALLEPWYHPLGSSIKTRPNCAVVEMLLRENRRVQTLKSTIQIANNVQEKCSSDQSSVVDISRTVLQLLPHHEQQVLPPYWIARSESIDLDFISIHNSDINIPLSTAIKNCQVIVAVNNEISTDTDLRCVAHHLGGMQLSNSLALDQSRPSINTIFSLMGSSKSDQLYNNLGGGTCNSKLGYAVFSNSPTPADQLRKTSAIVSHVSTIFAALPPNHPASLCIPPFEHTIGISHYNEANNELSPHSTFANKLLTEIESRHSNSTRSVWAVATIPCDFAQARSENTFPDCCNQVSVTILDSTNTEDIAKHLNNEHANQNNNKQNHHLIFTSSTLNPSSDSEEEVSHTQSNRISVKISELSNNIKPSRRRKESIQMKLRSISCEPGWFCNRCLQSAQHGSFSICASTCGDCAINAICNGDNTKNEPVKIDVEVTGLPLPTTTSIHAATTERHNRIPRIIHQTYFEEITMEKHPQLLRLKNTWLASGWEYRFYTDDTARQYITTSYPSRFVSVFDALLPGAYKADFFRYLVLFKEGGIYVDVDVMLNTNLDSFIAPDLAFFAPLDAVGTISDEQYCVWNGLLGSAPGHPALTNVIEWMVNLVSNRGDMYDMERAVCGFSGKDKIENWKLRAEPGLMLSGPCALGLAVNNALGNEPLSKFRPGLLTRDRYNQKNVQDLNTDAVGNVMILVADKDDLGAFRFNDPERNVIIASTDLASLSKAPMIYAEGSSKNLRSRNIVKQKPHYSVSTHGEQLWGTHDVYADDIVEDEQVSLVVSYK